MTAPPKRLLALAAALAALGVAVLATQEDRAEEERRTVTGPGATFEVAYSHTVPGEAKDALEHAARLWAGWVVSPVTIRVRASFVPLGVKGFSIPNGIRDFTGAPFDSTWYPVALADAIAARDHHPGFPDMEIFFATSARWYFGADGRVPAGEIDLVSVALHEICHGLGFGSLFEVKAGLGSYGHNDLDQFPPLSFRLPDLAGLPSVFDRFVENEAGEKLVAFPNRSRELHEELTADAVYFGGSAGARNGRPRLTTPVPNHVAPSYAGGPDDLMTPAVREGEARQSAGPVVHGVLRALGWTLAPGASDPKK